MEHKLSCCFPKDAKLTIILKAELHSIYANESTQLSLKVTATAQDIILNNLNMAVQLILIYVTIHTADFQNNDYCYLLLNDDHSQTYLLCHPLQVDHNHSL